MSETKKPSSFLEEAFALLNIAKALEELPDNAMRCRAMAQACLHMKRDDDAIAFINLAKQWDAEQD